MTQVSPKNGPGNDAAASSGSPSPSAAVNLPKGGGAIRSIGEKFAANPATGTGAMSVPIPTSPGRSGFGPKLSIAYDSGAGNGAFGFGWNLALPRITRKTDKGLPRYLDAQDSDVFILSGAEDLVPVFRQDANGDWVRGADGEMVIHEDDVDGHVVRRYRPRVEGQFVRIERWTRSTDAHDVHWRTISQENILTVYGSDADARIVDPEDASRIFSWLICETRDDKGNVVVYRYKAEDGLGVDLGLSSERNRGTRADARRTANRYLKHVYYGNRKPVLDADGVRPRFLDAGQIDDRVANGGWMFEVVFDYGEHDTDIPTPQDAGEWKCRVDAFSTYRSGFEVRTYRRCERVLMFHHFPGAAEVGRDCLVHSTDLAYAAEEDAGDQRTPTYSFLRAVVQTGYRRHDAGYDRRSMPGVEFEYTMPVVQQAVHEIDAASLENLPIGVDGSTYQWIDLHGEGIPGILTEQADAWFYARNLSPMGREPVEFAPLQRVASKPNLALAGGSARFMDLAGDGQPDLVTLDGPLAGLYEHDDEEGWNSFQPFRESLNHSLRDPNVQLVDLDGDGHADVLITEDDTLVWHPSLAEEGFGPAQQVSQALDEEDGPRLVFADTTQSIFLADLSGDGLTDLVRIRNGDVCYWPNLGYGRFGARVAMDDAPVFDNPDQFDHRRLRAADIDGTGTTDLVYLHRDGARLYFNQSGNGWSAPLELAAAPGVDDVVSVAVTDLFGNGTACLVWSSPLPGDARLQMRYVDLMGGRKPHLLAKTVNNLGAETRVEYSPSTKFSLQDRAGGRPWITRLPFPIHVVERVESIDHVSRNRFVTRHSYHHGYFDGEEREFRGFGMVEHFDTELLGALTDSDVIAADNIAPESNVPAVHTKTWFHTGMYAGRDHVSDYFAGLLDPGDHGEYFREPGLTDDEARDQLLADTVLPEGLTLADEVEACRSLAGSMLRQEVYALDGSAEEAFPYLVTEQNFSIRCVQPRESNLHGVFFSHPLEAIHFNYERNPGDPRVQHSLQLELDDVGNVLKEAAVAYGRRANVRVSDAAGNVQSVPNPGLASLTAADQEKQTGLLTTYTEHRFTNAVESADVHRHPLACETRAFELTGYVPTGAAGRLQPSDLVEPDPATKGRLRHIFLEELAYEETAAGDQRRRLIECVRTLYRNDDLTGILPLGQLESRGLPGESYKLAFTPGLVSEVFRRPRANQAPEPLLPDPDSVLGGQGDDGGGYVASQALKADGRFPATDGDGHWWIPSGRSFLSDNAADSAAVELAEAQTHFFLPRRVPRRVRPRLHHRPSTTTTCSSSRRTTRSATASRSTRTTTASCRPGS